METLESMFYEAKPYLFLAGGIYAMTANEPNHLVIIIALVLMFTAAIILRLRFKSRKNSGIEAIFYEAQPYLYLGLAGYTLLTGPKSPIAVGSALLLLFAATIILRWRARQRHGAKR